MRARARMLAEDCPPLACLRTSQRANVTFASLAAMVAVEGRGSSETRANLTRTGVVLAEDGAGRQDCRFPEAFRRKGTSAAWPLPDQNPRPPGKLPMI